MHITTRNLLVASVVKVSNYLKTLTPSRIWTHDLQITSLMLCQLSYRWRLKSLIQSDLFWIFYSICLTSTSMFFVTVGLSQTSQARVNGPPLIPIFVWSAIRLLLRNIIQPTFKVGFFWSEARGILNVLIHHLMRELVKYCHWNMIN